jgi:hypothetical protein
MAYKRSMGYTASMASGSTLTAEVDLGQAFDRVLLGVPTMASGCNVRLQVARATGDTYRNLYHESQVDSTTPTIIDIDSSVTQAYVPVGVMGAQYVKVEITTAMTATSAQFDLVGISL